MFAREIPGGFQAVVVPADDSETERLINLQRTGWLMGRWRGPNNSSMNELIDIVKMLCRCAIGWHQLMRMADMLSNGQLFE